MLLHLTAPALPFTSRCLTAFDSVDEIEDHHRHLICEPTGLAVPWGWDGTTEKVILTGSPPVKWHPELDGEPLVEVVAVRSGTRAGISVADVAHARECSSASCIAVWQTAQVRQARFNAPYYGLCGAGPRCAGGPQCIGGAPLIRPVDDWYVGAWFPDKEDETADCWVAVFDVSASNAERIRRGTELAHIGIEPVTEADCTRCNIHALARAHGFGGDHQSSSW